MPFGVVFSDMNPSYTNNNSQVATGPQNSFVLGLLRSCLEATAANAKLNENDSLVSWFQSETYVDTTLDILFTERMTTLTHDLVFLSGTPGSGKTQYIKKLQAVLVQHHGFEEVQRSPNKSGTFVLQKDVHKLCVKHDATQVDNEAENAASQLADLLKADWSDDEFDKQPKQQRYLIGINQGVLQRLLARDEFSRLSRHITQEDTSEQRILKINLEKRSAVFPKRREDAFITKILAKLCDSAYWEDPPLPAAGFRFQTCHGCPLLENSCCPILTNVRRLRESDTTLRINHLFEINHYRPGQITTFRDVIAVLAKILVGYHTYYANANEPCEELRAFAASDPGLSVFQLSRLLYYNSAFSSSDPWQEYVSASGNETESPYAGYAGPYFEQATDSTCNMTRLDPARSPSDALRALDDAVYNHPETFLGMLRRQSEIEEHLADALERRLTEHQAERDSQQEATRRGWLLFCLVRLARRHRIFHGPEPIFSLVPYDYADVFADVLVGLQDNRQAFRAVAGDLLVGLSGLSGARAKRGMSLSCSESQGRIKAQLVSDPTPRLTQAQINEEYVETYPRALTLHIQDNSDPDRPLASIEIGLDAWESLQRSAKGYLRDYLGTEYPLALDGAIEGLRARTWDIPGASLVVSEGESEVTLRRAGEGVELY